MVRSKVELERLDENALRQDVLIPLFEKMGFQDVGHYHGGSQELGKDIVMWKPGAFRDRETFAVVAKATRITGKAIGGSSAAEVTFQIRQCLGSSFQDLTTPREFQVDRCLVVSSRKIKKESIIAIRSAIGTDYSSRVDFWDGDKVWKMVQEHFPPTRALEHLRAAGEVFDGASEHHRIIPMWRDGILHLSTEPKHPRAHEVEPLNFKFDLEFPNSPLGKETLSAVQKHFRTGERASIPGEFIQNIDIPNLLRPYFGAKPQLLELGPRQSDRPIVTNLIIERDDGREAFRVDGVEFRAVQLGSDEITLDNEHQAVPWHFRLRIDLPAKMMNVTFGSRGARINARRARDVLRLQEALGLGGSLVIESAETGLRMGSSMIPQGSFESPPQEWLDLLDDLVFIQSRTNVPIEIPARDLTAREVHDVVELAKHLRSVVVDLPVESVSFVANRWLASQIAGDPPVMLGNFMYTQDRVWKILETTIDVGRVVTMVYGVRVAPATIESLRRMLADQSVQSFPVRLEPIGDTMRVIAQYTRWMPEESVAAIDAKIRNAPKANPDDQQS